MRPTPLVKTLTFPTHPRILADPDPATFIADDAGTEVLVRAAPPFSVSIQNILLDASRRGRGAARIEISGYLDSQTRTDAGPDMPAEQDVIRVGAVASPACDSAASDAA